MIFEDRVIKTPRLEIKQLNFLDKTRLSELLMNKEISQTYMIPDFKSIEEANSLADRLIAISKERLAVGIHLNGMLIGWINDCDFDADSIEIGYVIDPVYKGQGYATEAVKAIIQYLFSIGFKKIAAAFFEANIPSKRVMEKCNMVDVGITTEVEYRGVIHKCIYYGIQTNKND